MLERIRGANLKQRFVAATALFVVVAFCLGGYALHVSREQNKSLDWARRVIVAHESLHSSNDALANARRGERTYLLYGDETGLTQYNDSMNEFRTDFSTALTILRADLPSTLGMLDQLNASVASWVSGDADKGIALRQNWTGSAADLQTATFALAQDTSVQALFTDVSNRVGAALIAVRASLAQRVGHIQDQNRSLTWIVLVTLLLMLVFSGATATFLYRGIVRPIDRLSVAAIAIADGDFSRRTGIEKQDEIGRAAQAFDFMAGRVEPVWTRKVRLGQSQRTRLCIHQRHESRCIAVTDVFRERVGRVVRTLDERSLDEIAHGDALSDAEVDRRLADRRHPAVDGDDVVELDAFEA